MGTSIGSTDSGARESNVRVLQQFVIFIYESTFYVYIINMTDIIILSKPDIKKDIALFHEQQRILKEQAEHRRKSAVESVAHMEDVSRFGMRRKYMPYVTK